MEYRLVLHKAADKRNSNQAICYSPRQSTKILYIIWNLYVYYISTIVAEYSVKRIAECHAISALHTIVTHVFSKYALG